MEIHSRKKVSKSLILYAGRIDVTKGCEVLVEAVALAQKRLGDCTVILAGPDWGSQKYLEKLAASRNVRAIFTGNLSKEQLKEALVSCDVFILPSFEESFPTCSNHDARGRYMTKCRRISLGGNSRDTIKIRAEQIRREPKSMRKSIVMMPKLGLGGVPIRPPAT